MSDLYALLIAVDFYFPNTLPDGGSYPSLGGCVRDVRHVEEHLKKRLKLPPAHILKLTATNTGGAKPAEPPNLLPTYENMVARFKELIAAAKSGDQVYIHYSGHGGRAKTIYPDLKGANGRDECLVPTDIGNSEARYLRDVELAYLLKEMVDKGLVITVVFDSCHSGGATRGVGGARPRGISSVDATERPTASLVASTAELVAAWRGLPGGTTRAAKPASGWLLEPQGYTLFAACRANESAYEFPFNGLESNGALTYWLLDTLRQAGPGFSYKMVFDRVLAKVHGQFAEQTPQLQGAGDRRVFGSDEIEPFYAATVLEVQGQRVRLDAGEAHGIGVGSQFAVYPPGAEFADESARRALLEVEELTDGVSSWARITEEFGRGPVEQGGQAVLLNNVEVRLQRNVAIITSRALHEPIERAIGELGQGFIKVASPGERVDFQVAHHSGNDYELWDSAGAPLPNIRPPLRVSDPDALPKLVRRLVHLAKYRSVQDLDVPDPAARQKLRVAISGASDNAGETPIFRPGDRVKLKITNLQEPNPDNPNDPARVLNVTVLDLQSDWGISQVYPEHAGAFEPVDPQQTIDLEFEAYLPDGYTESTDTLKVFATRATTSFRWLELPPLDEPDTRSRSTRSAVSDPLEQMFAKMTGDQAATRALRLSSSRQDKGWTVAQVELRVQG